MSPGQHFTRDRELQRRHRRGDTAARDRLVENYLPLARQLASRYRHRSESSDDLNQVAYLGLLAAVNRWDPERGAAFTSFAVPTILGELRRYFRDSTWMVRPPRDVQELWLKVTRANDDLWQELGRAPTTCDVAAYIGATIEDVNDALQAGTIRSRDSLDEPLSRSDDTGATRLEHAPDPRDQYGTTDTSIAIDQLSNVLDARSREVLRLRYCEDLLQREIAERVGCSQMHVSRILREAIIVLQHRAESELRTAETTSIETGSSAAGRLLPQRFGASTSQRGRRVEGLQ